MFSYRIDLFENKIWTALKSWARPFTDGTALNDVLDAGTINVSCTKRSKPIKPFTKLRVIISEDGTEVDRIYRLVASTKRVRRSFAPSLGTRYDWTINTIEVTKDMERRFIGTMTCTGYLAKFYREKILPAKYELSADSNGDFKDLAFIKQNYLIPIVVGDSFDLYNPTTLIAFSGWTIDKVNQSYVQVDNEQMIDTTNVTTDVVGTKFASRKTTYSVRCYIDANIRRSGSGTKNAKGSYIFYVSAVDELNKSKPTIVDVCNRLLYAGITRRKDIEDQEYLLDPVFTDKYKDVESPEFSFTNSTLFDALAQVGGRIHAIPRLIPRYIRDGGNDDTHYYVTFDELGGNEQAPTLPPMVYQDHNISIDDWCGTLDCPSQNLCNTEDESAGAITELGNDYITCRTEDGTVEVTADNVIIRTSMPIQKLVKLECGFIPEYDGGNTPVGDITAYVYEQAEYLTLSSYWGSSYPYSKGWALSYSQGSSKITGLSFIVEGDTSVSTAANNYSIVNIINAKTGLSLEKQEGKWMQQLAFKVTYVPIVNSRVQARKPAVDEGGEDNNQLVYNQGANVAETSFYGEKMRGAIARLGQDVEQRTYDIFHYSQMPKCGQLLDGKYIANIDASYDITKIRITVTLTKNFNQLSQYVGLNSNYRLYDVSEKQSVDRHIHYSETILIGSKASYNAQDLMIIKDIAQMLGETIYPLKYKSDTTGKVQVGQLLYEAKDGNVIAPITVPVCTFSFGTSICFAFSMYDNYGAGFRITNEYEREQNKAVQKLVPYSDDYGETEYVDFWMQEEGWTPSLAEQQTGLAQAYPETIVTQKNVKVSTGNNPLIISKDSREHLSFVYQCHFQATRSSIVIGSALARYNLYVNKLSGKMAITALLGVFVLWFDHTINGLNRYFDTDTDGVVGQEQFLSTSSEDPLVIDNDGFLYWKARNNPTEKTVYSYAVCRAVANRDGSGTVGVKFELLFGENFEDGLAPGASTQPIYFCAYPKFREIMVAPRGTLVYDNEKGSNAIGSLYLQKPVKPSVNEYSFISDARINRYTYWYTETFENTGQLTIKLKYAEIAQTLKMYADGTELVEGIEYEVGSDFQTISLLNVAGYVKEIKAVYRVGTKNALDNSDGYVKTSDLVPFD